tara:strand:+ start:331 stop:1077 length:747 start_codon:yes stop_codon:yes gene_type:complete
MDTKDYRLFSEAYANIYTENQIEPEVETIEEGEWFGGLKKKFNAASDAYNNSRGVPSPRQIDQQRSKSPFAKPSGVTVTQTRKPTPKTPYSKGEDGKLTDFGAGGGKAKMAKTGMSASEVEQQGRANKGKRLPQIDDHSKYHKNSFEPEGEMIDLFDLVKDFLMSEGYANNEKSALAIMSNMSEEWRKDIIESIENDLSVIEQAGVKATATDGHGNTYRDYSNDGLSDRQRRMKEFGAKRAAMLVKKV